MMMLIQKLVRRCRTSRGDGDRVRLIVQPDFSGDFVTGSCYTS
jgi:hypothetical protein